MLKYIVPLVMFVALGAFLFVGLQRDPAYVPSPLIGKAAPEFSLPSLQDAAYPISTKDLAGQPWVLNVWGTWCGGCREEHDVLLAIAKQNVVPLIGLNWKDDNAAAQAWLQGPRQPVCGGGGGPGGADGHRLGRVRRARDVPDRARRHRAVQAHRADDARGLDHGVPAAHRGGAQRGRGARRERPDSCAASRAGVRGGEHSAGDRHRACLRRPGAAVAIREHQSRTSLPRLPEPDHRGLERHAGPGSAPRGARE